MRKMPLTNLISVRWTVARSRLDGIDTFIFISQGKWKCKSSPISSCFQLRPITQNHVWSHHYFRFPLIYYNLFDFHKTPIIFKAVIFDNSLDFFQSLITSHFCQFVHIKFHIRKRTSIVLFASICATISTSNSTFILPFLYRGIISPYSRGL